MRSDKLFDAGAFLLIVGLGLTTAWICFGVLNSQANGRFEGYSLGGALAGAMVSWGLLTTIYLKLQKSSNELEDLRKKSSNELEDLRKQNKTLEDKLIRGAPHPEGFIVEVDERQRIVLARPKAWEPKGGIIFQLELSDEEMKPDDSFAAVFTCSFVPIDERSKQTWEQFHQSQIDSVEESVKTGFCKSYNEEAMKVGGDVEGVKSLKIVARMAAKVKKELNPVTQRMSRNWWIVPWWEFVGWIYEVVPGEVSARNPVTITIRGSNFRSGAVCYVNGQQRETEVVSLQEARVKLEPEDVARSGILELAIANPETRGKRSDAVRLKVSDVQPVQPAVAAAAATEKPEQNAAGAQEGSAERKIERPMDSPKKEEAGVAYLEVDYMIVYCYQKALEKIFYFEFWDDSKDFLETSHEFNLLLASTRFLS